MKDLKIKRNIGTKGGYALYFAIVLTALLILVSYITANISIKELALSTSAADSHIAFYNTDTGLECALYWDLKNPGGISAFDITTPSASVSCNGTDNPVALGMNGSDYTRTFQINLSQGCAIVVVTKYASGTTLIESRGYNVCSGSRRLERGVKIQY